MQLTVKGKHLDVGDALRAHVKAHLSRTAERYFKNSVEATVIFTKEKGHRYRADVSVHVGEGIVLQAHHEANDPYPAFDMAAQRVSKRLSRYKERLRDHHRWEDKAELLQASYSTLQSNDDGGAEGGSAPVVISEMQTTVQTLAVADAVMRLDLGDLPALMFVNPKHGGFNMVYRRKDGNIGWLDPVGNGKLMASKATVKPIVKPIVKPVGKSVVKLAKKVSKPLKVVKKKKKAK